MTHLLNNQKQHRNLTRIIPTRTINMSAKQCDNTAESITQSSTSTTVSLKNNTTYIFGDIEGSEPLFDSTLKTIEANISNDDVKFIFLGDLYDYDKPNETIAMIDKIMKQLNIPIPEIFSAETKEIEIIRVFRKLWKLKQMKHYNKFNIQYLRCKLKPEQIQPFKHIFIIGNKEVIFVQEIITCEHISKLPDNSFSIPADYKFKRVKEGCDPVKHTNYNLTYEELNIMHAYISNCVNLALIDETLYIHCYINYKYFKDVLNVNRIISGHSKGYGKFVDSEFPGIDI